MEPGRVREHRVVGVRLPFRQAVHLEQDRDALGGEQARAAPRFEPAGHDQLQAALLRETDRRPYVLLVVGPHHHRRRATGEGSERFQGHVWPRRIDAPRARSIEGGAVGPSFLEQVPQPLEGALLVLLLFLLPVLETLWLGILDGAGRVRCGPTRREHDVQRHRGLEGQGVGRGSREPDEGALARDEPAGRCREGGGDAVGPRHRQLLAVRVEGHPGPGVWVDVAHFRRVHRARHALDLHQAEGGEAVDQARVDGLSGAVDHGGALGDGDARPDRRHLPARDQDRAFLDHRPGHGDDPGVLDDDDGPVGGVHEAGRQKPQPDRREGFHCAPPTAGFRSSRPARTARSFARSK